MSYLRRSIGFLAGAMIAAGLTSCHRNEVEIVPVEGTITYGGGVWPVSGMLYFTPLESTAKGFLRPGWARFDKEGGFRATTLREGDGLMPGTYRVAVEAFANPWIMGQPKPASCAPAQFESPQTSGLEAVVPPGQRRVNLRLDVPKR